ncbi:MAG TPA: DUF4350 domain-containing protein [Bacillales bacterium]|nr:DUF4350 domain-containing protein [Bacillales bacterium]
MQIQSQTKKTWLWLVVFLFLFLAASYFVVTNEPKAYRNYDSHSPSLTGTKAIYTYLAEKRNVDRWSYPPEFLPAQGSNRLLIMIGPYAFSEKDEKQGYIAFMKKGNTILFLHSNPAGQFGLRTEQVPESSADDRLIYNKNGDRYHASVHSSVRIQANESDHVLLYDGAGTIAVKRSYGKGQLVAAVAPDWMTNGKLLKQDHLVLVFYLLHEAGAGTHQILFDEYSHGFTQTPSVFHAYPSWLLAAGFQLVLFAMIGLWFAGKRFGPVIVPREETVRYSHERIRALAAWYVRERKYFDAFATQADYIKSLLQERWAVPYRKPWKDMAKHLETKWNDRTSEEIHGFLAGLAAILENKRINKQEYLLWSKRMERLRKEVEKE